ncbi:MAG: hypothetical protein QHH00_07435 [Methanomassiliicoccales archaeon]|jgi:hypothetical protein|nr:hypothetical protein [Methanomassiliicoccales archaeon]
MSVSIAICELDSDEALCKRAKNSIIKVYLNSVKGLEEYAEYDDVATFEDARRIFEKDWENFLKRNRIANDANEIYISKIKNDADVQRLATVTFRKYTGWINLGKVPESLKERILSEASTENRLTEWDMLGFDELNETCGRCPLSWDSGRGCIGTFGPDNSMLPEIARKYGCQIIADIPRLAKEGKKLEKGEIEQLLKEISVLRERLPNEGKIAIRRYGGVLDRLEAASKTSLKYNTRLYFV